MGDIYGGALDSWELFGFSAKVHFDFVPAQAGGSYAVIYRGVSIERAAKETVAA
ncbi:hypothetical protein [Paraburkholderia dipogonis]|uniref:hypothetical protein n=1 Tax=Paraburkholderia dipogonis TaxID=1211383 RepID=UPI00141BF125|nr:hypothetical protein [Paraburkholderia dipogonis]